MYIDFFHLVRCLAHRWTSPRRRKRNSKQKKSFGKALLLRLRREEFSSWPLRNCFLGFFCFLFHDWFSFFFGHQRLVFCKGETDGFSKKAQKLQLQTMHLLGIAADVCALLVLLRGDWAWELSQKSAEIS